MPAGLPRQDNIRTLQFTTGQVGNGLVNNVVEGKRLGQIGRELRVHNSLANGTLELRCRRWSVSAFGDVNLLLVVDSAAAAGEGVPARLGKNITFHFVESAATVSLLVHVPPLRRAV